VGEQTKATIEGYSPPCNRRARRRRAGQGGATSAL